MCCFSGPVKEVSGTKIFARGGEGLAQFIVYEMHVAAKEPVAMVLPVPVDQAKGDEALKFIDLKEYAHFFDDLDRAFFQPRMNKESDGAMMGMSGGRSMPLPVQRVGSFDASYVPTQADFARLDER